MTSVDWARAEPWFHRMKSLPVADRERLLEDLSRRDSALADEVVSLLSGHDGEGELDRLALRLVQPLRSTPQDLPAGSTIGPYEVVRSIAHGGMGDVYLARDTRLDRDVALKLLPPWLNRDPAARDRFLLEARAASSISHPNVCALFDVGTTADGRAYLVMPYIEGETLKQRLAGRPMDPSSAVRLAIEAARGLAAAHEKGIVHRDIKPANLLLGADGTVRIVDFGVAKVADLDLTAPGQTPGTARYMSPEQESGSAVDSRSDLWSLGAVLHEMLTGATPNRHGPVEPGTLPASLRPVVEKALAIDPADRYPDADALIRELQAAAPPSAESEHPAHRPSLVTVLLGVALLVVIALPFATRGVGRASGGDSPSAQTATGDTGPRPVAVIPFATSGNPETLAVWGEGVAYLLAPNLEAVDGLRSVDPAVVTRTWHDTMAASDGPADAMRAVRVASGLGARYAVLVTAVGAGTVVRLTADVYDARLRVRHGSVTVEGEADSLGLADDLTLGLVRRGLLPARGANPAALAGVVTRSLPAFEAYLAGEREYRRGRWEAAAGHFVHAAELDPTFARAVYRAWMSYVFAWDPVADEFARRAEAMVGRLSPRDSALLFGFPRDLGPQAIPNLEAYTSRYPEDPEGWIRLGDATIHLGGRALVDPDRYRNAWATGFALGGSTWEGRAHMLGDAFAQRDSARVRDLLDLPSPFAVGESACPGYEILYDATWGDDAARRRASEAIRNAPDSIVSCAWRSMAITDEGTERVANLDDQILPPLELRLMRGEASEYREILRGMMASEELANMGARYALMLSLLGMGDRDMAERGLRELERSDPSTASQRDLTWGAALGPFWVAVRAIEEGRYDSVQSEVARTRAAAGRIRQVAEEDAENRIVIMRYVDGTNALAAALVAYTAFRRSEGTDASDIARSSASLMTSPVTMRMPATYLRYATGVELLRRGAPAEAIRYLRSIYFEDIPFHVLAQFQLGKAYEAIGDVPRARDHYRVFVGWWENAAPELQPMVDEARSRLARLQ